MGIRSDFWIRMVGVYRRIIGFGIDENWSYDKKRAYRQVNEFGLLISFCAVSAIPFGLVFGNYPLALTQLAFTLIYLSLFVFISKGRIKEARLIGIYGYELNLLIHSVLSVYSTGVEVMPWYSPVFVLFPIFPITAALFDKPVFKHMLIAVLMILFIQVIAPYSSQYNYSEYIGVSVGIIITFTSFYALLVLSVLAYLVHSGNRQVIVMETEKSQQLEAVVNELTTREEIIQKQASDLKVLNDSKNKLFSVLAHDLKSPFNIILGFSEMLKEKSINDPEYHKYAKQLYETSLANYNLLDNLLEWSRSQLDQITCELSDFKVNEVLCPCLSLLEVSAMKKGTEIISRIDENLTVRADRSLLSIIFRNLITNAIKFTGPGGMITVGSRTLAQYAEIYVSDTGIGMPEKMANDLFKVDKKQSRPGTSAEKGTGLGLILCKEFIEKQGGTLRVESTEGEGTTFFFTVPLASVAVTAN